MFSRIAKISNHNAYFPVDRFHISQIGLAKQLVEDMLNRFYQRGSIGAFMTEYFEMAFKEGKRLPIWIGDSRVIFVRFSVIKQFM